MKRAFLVIFGLLLLALAAAWFLTDLPGVARDMLADRSVLGPRRDP